MGHRSGRPARPFSAKFAILYALDPNFREDAGLAGQQFALFPPDDCLPAALPEGLRYDAEFISPDLERELIGCVAALPLQPFQFSA